MFDSDRSLLGRLTPPSPKNALLRWNGSPLNRSESLTYRNGMKKNSCAWRRTEGPVRLGLAAGKRRAFDKVPCADSATGEGRGRRRGPVGQDAIGRKGWAADILAKESPLGWWVAGRPSQAQIHLFELDAADPVRSGDDERRLDGSGRPASSGSGASRRRTEGLARTVPRAVTSASWGTPPGRW